MKIVTFRIDNQEIRQENQKIGKQEVALMADSGN